MSRELSNIHVCTNCGHPEERAPNDARGCQGCNAPFPKLARVPFNSGYDRPHMVHGWVRAHNLERVAGAESAVKLFHEVLAESAAKLFHEVRGESNSQDVEVLRDLLAVTLIRLEELSVDEHAYVNCPYCTGPLGPLMRPPEGGDAWRTCRHCGNNVYKEDEVR